MAISFTDRELDVMAVLWRAGSGTVAEVRDALSEPFAYTTVLTVLRTLQEKGFVEHTAEGKAHRYRPRVTQEAAGKSALDRVLEKIFAGSEELLLAQLVSDRDVGKKKLRRLRKLLDTRLDERKAKKGERDPGGDKDANAGRSRRVAIGPLPCLKDDPVFPSY